RIAGVSSSPGRAARRPSCKSSRPRPSVSTSPTAARTPPEVKSMIWKQPISVEWLTEIHVNTAVAHLGIEFLEVGDDFLRARAPVDSRTRQPLGILHGGISVLLAETLGSCGAARASPPGSRALGLDINANHLR